MKISKKLSFLNKEENKLRLIGLLSILILFWVILYFIPNIFVSLFNTFLGITILILTTILVGFYNYKYGITIGIILIIIYRFAYLFSLKEGFTWTPDSTQDFLLIQKTINPNIVFDVNMIQNNQASQDELNYFNENGLWPWSDDVIELYKEAVQKNKYIRTWPDDSVNYARSIYNQTAILKILSYQTKEAQFLLNGVLVKEPNDKEDLPSGFGSFGYNSKLIGHLNKDIIKCNDKSKDNNNYQLERITYTGKEGIFGEQTKKITDVDYNDLENIIPGFKFINEPCNPCSALNTNTDYSCPYELKTKNNSHISNVWKYLWNI
jgi:hypothetical protein